MHRVYRVVRVVEGEGAQGVCKAAVVEASSLGTPGGWRIPQQVRRLKGAQSAVTRQQQSP